MKGPATNYNDQPGDFGSGSAGAYASNGAHPGAGGAVRIIWPGDERSFPSTRTVLAVLFLIDHAPEQILPGVVL